ncbi:MAG: Cation-transporting ATPase [Candidatus Jettenia ecosi]|uniref:Cation-transporting ATPase n=1 Tax=Candidatus Jettenia ecosi TaxID=2494326 RepID=A0A533Q888_9BACT|nr:MAG: Cation-transporting ATPase [Candidatus Jettenia ecosi]
MVELPIAPWTLPWQDVIQDLRVSPVRGLDTVEVKKRYKKFGSNRLQEVKKKSAWIILINQLKSLIILLLGVTTIVSFAFGEWVEGMAIGVVIVINTTIGFFTELKAVRSMEALRKLGSVTTKVIRNSQLREIPADELVPGDIVVFEGGDVVPADLRILEASRLQADESALTGESTPVSKGVEHLEEGTPLAERINMLFKGTSVTRGSAKGVTVSTGMETELGKISSLVESAREEVTPLEKRLNKLGNKLIWVTLAVAPAIATAGIITGEDILLMIKISIALAVATIPEGLPIVATLALARGMWRMAKRDALINRLSSVETLGATSIICTDKTGTLTENKMTVTRIVLDSGEIKISGEGLNTEGEFRKNGKSLDPLREKPLQELLHAGVFCNNASLEPEEKDAGKKAVGDPMEVALLVAGIKAGIDHNKLLAKMPEVREEAFDSEVKMMATFHADNNQYLVAVKGAAEALLKVCSHRMTEEGKKEMRSEDRKWWLERGNHMARDGLRVLAIAEKTVTASDSNPYGQLTFLGIVGFLDPPRSDVAPALALCRDAGIKVVMVTGDQPVTARNIALAVGLIHEGETEVIHGKDLKKPEELSKEDLQHILRVSVFARVDPKQKLDLTALYQKNGFVVAMTGDGVNDAPALKKADIGIAMGQRGTQVAREAADMILKDDNFSTIVAAIEQGRVIFNNIRKFALYLLSCNISEIMVIVLYSFIDMPMPILPLQILFLNLVTDVFPALALGVGEGDPHSMKYPPRNIKEPILTWYHLLAIGVYGMVITASVFGAYELALKWEGIDKRQAVSIPFITLAFAQLWHVFNMRDSNSSFFRNEITRNPFIWGALVLCTGLLMIAIYVPGLAAILKIVNPGAHGLILALVMSIIPWVTGQIVKIFRNTFL